MNNTTDGEFARYPAKRLRDCVRLARRVCRDDSSMSRKTLEQITAEHEIELGVLIAEGLFEPVSDNVVRITKAGIKVGVSVLQNRMSRAKIDALLTDVLAKIEEVKTDDRFVMAFEMLAVFGSYLRDEPDYGDLDLTYRLNYKQRWLDGWHDEGQDDKINKFHLSHFPADEHVWFMVEHPGIHNRPIQHIKARRSRVHLTRESDFTSLERKNGAIPHRILIGSRGLRVQDGHVRPIAAAS